MFVIRISIKTIYIFIFIILFISVILLILNISSYKKAGFNAFLHSPNMFNEQQKQIEIFDISEGKVVAKYKHDNIFQKEAVGYLESITGMYVKVKAFPNNGFIVKIPLSPPVESAGKHLKDCGITYVDEVYVIFPPQNKPYLLVLDEKSRPFLFNFDADTDNLKNYFIKKDNIYVN